MKHITLTIPRNDVDALRAGATMLWVLADKLAGQPADSTEAEQPAPPPTAPPTAEQPADSATCAAGECDDQTGGAAGEAQIAPADGGTRAPDVDADGLPWDNRIHAGSKTTTKDGRWKRKRGVDPELVEQVESELQQLMAIPAPADTAAPPPPPAAPAVPIASEPATPPPPAEQPAPPPTAPAAPPTADSATGEQPVTFPAFLKAVAGHIKDKAITTDRVNEIVRAAGVESMHLVGARPDLIPDLWAQIESCAREG